MTDMPSLRSKSTRMTGFLERRLLQPSDDGSNELYQIITPSNPAERGAQLSVLLQPGLLEGVMVSLEQAGVVVDERKPDVIRVAPAPLYNTYEEVWQFVNIFREACLKAKGGRASEQSVLVMRGKEEKAWSSVE